MKRLVLLTAALVLASAPHVSSAGSDELWDTVFLAAYPDYESGARSSTPERIRDGGRVSIDPYSDYVFDAPMAWWPLHEGDYSPMEFWALNEGLAPIEFWPLR